MANFSGWHLVVVLLIVLLLFGATRLPALARSIGQSMNAFKSEVRKNDVDETPTTPTDESADKTPKP
ncbi:MAG: tatA [Glaciihabitans sp.]|jgi:sec-independent protein translocase protein TatA|nr:tatA [Glaciihabitans sp.]